MAPVAPTLEASAPLRMGAFGSTTSDPTGLVPEPGAPTMTFRVTRSDAPPPGPPESLKKYYVEL